jgi:hypothetical protein
VVVLDLLPEKSHKNLSKGGPALRVLDLLFAGSPRLKNFYKDFANHTDRPQGGRPRQPTLDRFGLFCSRQRSAHKKQCVGTRAVNGGARKKIFRINSRADY